MNWKILKKICNQILNPSKNPIIIIEIPFIICTSIILPLTIIGWIPLILIIFIGNYFQEKNGGDKRK